MKKLLAGIMILAASVTAAQADNFSAVLMDGENQERVVEWLPSEPWVEHTLRGPQGSEPYVVNYGDQVLEIFDVCRAHMCADYKIAVVRVQGSEDILGAFTGGRKAGQHIYGDVPQEVADVLLKGKGGW